MEIKNTLTQLDPYTRTKRTDMVAPGAHKKTTAPATAETGDRVSLSYEAKLRTEAFSAASSAPEVRATKVAEIKGRVDSGEYVVDSKAVAASLLREEPGLFS